jgi:hypothetical protein
MKVLCLLFSVGVMASAATEAAFVPAPRPSLVPGHELMFLPENSRYFQYKGLPFVSFVRRGDTTSVRTPEYIDASVFDDLARNSNHLYLSVHKTWVRATWQELHDKLEDDGHWRKLEQVVRWAYDNDIMLSLVAWSFWWNYGQQQGGCREVQCTDMLFPHGHPTLSEPVINGLSRMDLHRRMIARLVEASWGYPNVTYNFMWEYGIMHVDRAAPTKDPDGSFHRWWVDEMKAEGQRQFPGLGMKHLFSIKYGGKHPSFFNADFIVEEDGNSIWRDGASMELIQSYALPLVPWASDQWQRGVDGAEGPFTDRANLTPRQVRELIPYGLHPAPTWRDLSPDAQEYYLQARWYMENIKTWEDEIFSGGVPSGGDEINEKSLPDFVPSTRPRLLNPDGYTRGAVHTGGAVEFAVLYQDPDGDPPAQAEVWVDLNGDGRFAPNPADGERIVMEGRGSDYGSGVLFFARKLVPDDKAELRYVFRFADQHWYPPAIGGLVPGNYGHWVIGNRNLE